MQCLCSKLCVIANRLAECAPTARPFEFLAASSGCLSRIIGALRDHGAHASLGPNVNTVRFRRAADLGLEFPVVTVEYRGLAVETDAFVGNSAMPTLTNTLLTSIKVCSVESVRKLFEFQRGQRSGSWQVWRELQAGRHSQHAR